MIDLVQNLAQMTYKQNQVCEIHQGCSLPLHFTVSQTIYEEFYSPTPGRPKHIPLQEMELSHSPT